jgi:integrase
MATANITKARVDRMADGDALWDSEVRGFGVRRRRRDTSYVLKYRANRRQRFVTIGKHGAPWTSETARREAQRLLGALRNGNDPAVQRDKLNREPTVAAVLDRYLRDHVDAHNKPTTRAEATRHVETILKPEFGKLKISELTRAEIKTWHSKFNDRPYEGNRSLAYLRKALALAMNEWELRIDNPALGVKSFPEVRRERFFSDAELQQIGKALAELEAEGETHPGVVRVIRLLALTGMRLSEVVGLRWKWIDFQAKCIHLPEAKAGARTVPLGDVALAYLKELTRISKFVCFNVRDEKKLVGHNGGPPLDDPAAGKGKPKPGAPISLKSVKRFWPVLRDRAKLTNARMHDFRHTVGTLAAATGANGFVVRDVLGHRSMSTTEGYVARVVDPIQKTADLVASRISAAMNGQTAEVVPIRKAT